MKPDGCGDIDAVAAGQTLEDDLSHSGHQPSPQQYQDVPPRTRLLRRAQKIGSRTAPHGVLYQLQQLRQYRCGYAGSDARQEHRQPENCCTRTRKGRGYHVTTCTTGCRVRLNPSENRFVIALGPIIDMSEPLGNGRALANSGQLAQHWNGDRSGAAVTIFTAVEELTF